MKARLGGHVTQVTPKYIANVYRLLENGAAAVIAEKASDELAMRYSYRYRKK